MSTAGDFRMSSFNPVSSVNEAALQVLQHYGPVTALKFSENRLIVGYGPVLKIFQIDNDSISLVHSKQAFKRNKIHSIAVHGNKIALAGGRSFAVLDVSSELNIHERAINEWIVACEFLSDNQLLILAAHNEVLQINVDTFQVVTKVHCEEKSILYSGSIRITESGKVYIAAGTVMSGVMIWDFESRRILHTLTEHEGSIFGVKIDQLGKYIISCSDDRSVKLYDFASGALLASGWGHGSRIWSLEFVTVAENSIRILSTGEDCTARIWEHTTGSKSLDQLELWDHCHLGKHVWSGDASLNLKALATGGADGKVRIHDVSDTRHTITTHTTAEISSVPFAKKEVIKQFFELTEVNLLVVMTSFGKVLTLDQNTNVWEHIEIEDSSIKEFALLRGFASVSTVVICTRNADILVLGFDKTSQQPRHCEWIRNESETPKKIINALADDDEKKSEFLLFFDCANPNTPFDLKLFSFKDGALSLQKSLHLFRPDPRIFTPTSIHLDRHNLWLVVGSRHANTAVYNLKIEHFDLPQIVCKLSPGDTVTSISRVETGDNRLVALFTVRDGLYLYVKIFINAQNKFDFDIILQNKLSRGFIEGGFVKNNQLFVYGFRSLSFYLWNETKQIEIASEICGGAHRQWELLRFHNKLADYKFVYLSKSSIVMKTMVCRFKHSNHGLLVEGTHGREIRDIAVSPVQEQDSTKLFVSASEDASIKLGNLSQNGEIVYQWSMNNHISGLQRVAFLNHEYIMSSAANEELLAWRLTRLSNSVVTITEDCRIEPTDENPDLRIMDFASKQVPGGFWIAAVYSNSKIKVFFYDTAEKKFTLAAEDTYGTVCILNVDFLSNGNKTYLMIGTTDGMLTIWDASSALSTGSVSKLENLAIKQQLHQSAVKAILPISAGAGDWLIFTGGDDNALVCSRLTTTEAGLNLETKSFVEDAASATITSISPASGNRIFVSSVDQIIRLWRYTEGQLVCESATYTTVADTGCSDTAEINGTNLGVVAGAGLSSWTWK